LCPIAMHRETNCDMEGHQRRWNGDVWALIYYFCGAGSFEPTEERNASCLVVGLLIVVKQNSYIFLFNMSNL
jgi:hypothetical protein